MKLKQGKPTCYLSERAPPEPKEKKIKVIPKSYMIKERDVNKQFLINFI